MPDNLVYCTNCGAKLEGESNTLVLKKTSSPGVSESEIETIVSESKAKSIVPVPARQTVKKPEVDKGTNETEKKKKKVNYASAWAEAKKVIWRARYRLAVGSILLLISRLAGMVLPASMKYIGDEVFTKHNYSLLTWIAVAIGISTLIQGITGFTLSQILGVAAQPALTEMLKNVPAHKEQLAEL